MTNDITLTPEQAAPFKAQMVKNICFDARHKKSIYLNNQPIKAYPHDNGWKITDLPGLWWLYITCPECGYQWALHKLGIPQNFNPNTTTIFSKHQTAIETAKTIGLNLDVYGNPKPKLPCDDITTWLGHESCAKCPQPCPEPETPSNYFNKNKNKEEE